MDEMDQADQELRQAIGRSWPFTKRDGKLDLQEPRRGMRNATERSVEEVTQALAPLRKASPR